MNNEIICDECDYNYLSGHYYNLEGKCKSCYYDSNKNCYICSENEQSPCDFCDKSYALINNNCVYCPDLFGNKCIKCSEKQCLECDYGFGLLYEKNCSNCATLFGEGCSKCGINPYDFKPYCSECKYNYFFDKNGGCKKCELSNCNKCEDLGINEIICLSCQNNYQLKNGKCEKICGSHQIINENGNCENCDGEYIGLLNCENCIKENNNYKCTKCYNYYNLLNGKCINIEEKDIKICNEIENISTEETPIYSCVNCPINEDYIPIIKKNGAKICVKNSDYKELINCELGFELNEGNNNYSCSKCTENSNSILKFNETFSKNVCECIEGFFYDTNEKKCRKCSEIDNGCLKCKVSIGNYYYMNCEQCEKNYAKDENGFCRYCNNYCDECVLDENSNPVCLKYEEPYFLTNTSQIKPCYDFIPNCSVCSYIDDEKKELKCDKCLNYYYMDKNEKCVECYENIDINSGCLICSDEEEKLKNKKCDKCKENYFITNENICVFCLSEKYGGINCEKCDYINKTNEEEKIGCIKCLNDDFILLNGKCYPPIDNCVKYESYLNYENETNIKCIECIDNYTLNTFNRCKKIEVIILNCKITNEDINNPKCLTCEKGYDLIDDKCEEKISSETEAIEGCLQYSSKYGYDYCIECNNTYFLRMGFCVEKYKSIYYDSCNEYKFENGLFECKKCSSNQISLLNHTFCNLNFFDRCKEIINLGTNFRPIYSCNKCVNDLITNEEEMVLKIVHQKKILIRDV